MLENFESSIFVRKYIFHFLSLIRMVFENRSIAYSRALSIAFKAQKKITIQVEYPSSIDLLFIRAPKGLSQSDGAEERS